MADMPDYSFYTDTYLGELIPQKSFGEVMARAQDTLTRYKRIYTVTSDGTESEKMALCAMAEAIYKNRRREGIHSASAGEVTVRYTADRKQARAVYDAARIYLDIRRAAVSNKG